MIKNRILVIGATGQVGNLVAEHLKNDSTVELIVATRKEENLSKLTNTYGKAVYLDLDDPTTFDLALKSVDRLFLLTGYSFSMLTQSKTLIDAAIKAQVKHIVHLGVFSKRWDCTVPHFIWHQMIEMYISDSKLQWTFLHPNCFLQNLTSFSVLTNGKLRWYTTKPCGWIALEDIGECTAKILSEGPDKHHRKNYWFSTESLDVNQLASILSRITKLNIHAEPRLAKLFIEDLGQDPKIVDPYFFSVAEACQQIEDGRMDYIGHVQDEVPIVLNRKGLSVEEWADKHKAELIALAEKENSPLDWGKTK